LIEQVDRAQEALVTAGKGTPYNGSRFDCSEVVSGTRTSQP